MTKSDFLFICNSNNINPQLAFENSEVRKILKKKMNDINKQLLLNSFLKANF